MRHFVGLPELALHQFRCSFILCLYPSDFDIINHVLHTLVEKLLMDELRCWSANSTDVVAENTPSKQICLSKL